MVLWLFLQVLALPTLEGLVPVQRAVLAGLMPEREITALDLRQSGAQLSLHTSSRTTQYLIVRGRAYAPGLVFDAETPARAALLNFAMTLAGGVLLLRLDSWRAALRWSVLVVVAMAMATLLPALVLAGAQWGLAVSALEDASGPALLVALSDLIVHGGNYALCVAVVWVLRQL